MSPSFLIKILHYTYRPFTSRTASSAYVRVGHCVISKDIFRWVHNTDERLICVKQKFNEERWRHYPDKIKFYFILLQYSMVYMKQVFVCFSVLCLLLPYVVFGGGSWTLLNTSYGMPLNCGQCSYTIMRSI